jgi:hypothetical protein
MGRDSDEEIEEFAPARGELGFAVPTVHGNQLFTGEHGDSPLIQESDEFSPDLWTSHRQRRLLRCDHRYLDRVTDPALHGEIPNEKRSFVGSRWTLVGKPRHHDQNATSREAAQALAEGECRGQRPAVPG